MSSLSVPIPPDLSPACRAEHTDLGTVPPGTVVAEFEALRDAEPLPNPGKGDHSWYYPPAFKPYPYGVGYTDQSEENAWLGPHLGSSGG